jgi:hypothetical protein
LQAHLLSLGLCICSGSGLRLLLCGVLHPLLLSEHLLLLLNSQSWIRGPTLVIHAHLLPRHYPTRLWRGIPLGSTSWHHHLACLLCHHPLLLLINKISHVSHK